MKKESTLQTSRIFVNRSLNMALIQSIGFDMDHTLAIYQKIAFENLAFQQTLKKFISAGYPQELAELEFDPNFVIRGLLVDYVRGNLLKVDAHRYVKKAYHGHHELEKSERHRLYNADPYKPESFLSIDTFFALSEVQLFVEIIDFMRKYPGKINKSFHEVYQDLRKFIDASHADGTIKSEVMAAPHKYVVKDKKKAEALLRYRHAGKKIFLLTNSNWEYTNCLMSYLYNDVVDGINNWQDYFDFILVGAAKPSFFTGKQPFYEVMPESGYLKTHQGPLSQSKIYHGGNGHKFQELTHQRGDQILYCGDHIYGDIIRSKEVFNWRTLAVVEELVDELKQPAISAKIWQEISQVFEKREVLDAKIQDIKSQNSYKSKKKSQSSQGDLKALEKDLLALDLQLKEYIAKREQAIHPVWGDIMRVGLEKSRFARQIENYACLYTTDIANLDNYSPFKRFRSAHDRMPHDPAVMA